ncbi:hypothetical protein KSC_027940 [Ktedonobacter sp. SOSP1-52]|uniref:hypothetical protein n=1 Tax=Ktedonobacter sp. SOSP1-52 TaxID=2778366 RepID=UPI001915E33E|nr:hypothetical protein [Ktedonobacter sp. SOSP1-52]GHO63902.1 hypothetical protein KSC_027940 [Ktedonobacter sp. SOSP1-52]
MEEILGDIYELLEKKGNSGRNLTESVIKEEEAEAPPKGLAALLQNKHFTGKLYTEKPW